MREINQRDFIIIDKNQLHEKAKEYADKIGCKDGTAVFDFIRGFEAAAELYALRTLKAMVSDKERMKKINQRLIKFRSYNKVKKAFIFSDWKYGEISFWEEVCNDFAKEYHPAQQFTGLYDSKGVEVYEGDIVIPVNIDDRTPYEIKWRDDLYMIVGVGPDWLCLEEFKGCEIIGNIYQNPELLKP